MESKDLSRGLRAIALPVALVLGLASPGQPDDAVSLGGYFKTFASLIAPPTITTGGRAVAGPAAAVLSSRLRLDLTIRPMRSLSFDLAYDLSPRIQSAGLFEGGLFPAGQALGGYRLADLRDRLVPGPGRTPRNIAVFQNLDRLMVTFKTGFADIIVGRQPLAWGSARVVNPTDVLAPFAFSELDKEERTGVDAVRVRVPLGSMDELDMGAVAGDGFRAGTSAFFLRGKVHALRTDISGLALAFRQHLLLGLDLARSIGGAGAWVEAAYVIPDALLAAEEGQKDYFRASAGLDYNFSTKVYGFAEYHFNSAGGREPGSYLPSLATTPYRDGAVYLLGRHYFSVGSTWQAAALFPVTGLVIVNLTDLSLIIAPSLDWNVSQNVYLSGGAYLGLGRRPEIALVPAAAGLQPNLLRSEFGSYPDLIYVSFRIYF